MNDRGVVCATCLLLGVVLPWAMLIGAAVISQLSGDPAWRHTAGVMVAGGLLLMVLSAGVQRKARRMHEQGRM